MQDFPKNDIGFGGAAVSGEGKGYGFGSISTEESIQLIRSAYEAGVRLFDTAPIYGFGESERRIGRAIKGFRDKVKIVSKSGVTWDKNKRVDKSNDPKVCQSMLEQSLKDLDTDYIDLYMVHWPDPRCDIRYTIEYLAKRKEAGDILYIGLCNTNFEDYQKASEIINIDAIQDTYNAFNASSTKKRYDFLKRDTTYIMGYATLDKGILTARVTKERTFDANDCRSWAPWWKKEDRSKKYKLVEALQKICKQEGVSLLDFAISYVLKHDDFVDIALIGMKSPDSVKECKKIANTPLKKEVLNKIISQWTKKGYS